jgi:hypothetical protein
MLVMYALVYSKHTYDGDGIVGTGIRARELGVGQAVRMRDVL